MTTRRPRIKRMVKFDFFLIYQSLIDYIAVSHVYKRNVVTDFFYSHFPVKYFLFIYRESNGRHFHILINKYEI